MQQLIKLYVLHFVRVIDVYFGIVRGLLFKTFAAAPARAWSLLPYIICLPQPWAYISAVKTGALFYRHHYFGLIIVSLISAS